MKVCDFKADCYFLNVKTAAMPLTTGPARAVYCQGDFTRCTIYRSAKTYGIDKIPRYVAPGDRYELHRRIVENCTLIKFSG